MLKSNCSNKKLLVQLNNSKIQSEDAEASAGASGLCDFLERESPGIIGRKELARRERSCQSERVRFRIFTAANAGKSENSGTCKLKY